MSTKKISPPAVGVMGALLMGAGILFFTKFLNTFPVASNDTMLFQLVGFGLILSGAIIIVVFVMKTLSSMETKLIIES